MTTVQFESFSQAHANLAIRHSMGVLQELGCAEHGMYLAPYVHIWLLAK